MSRVSSFAARTLLIAIVALISGAADAHAAVGSVDFTLGYRQLSHEYLELGRLRQYWELGTEAIGASADTLTPTAPTQPGLGIELTWGRSGWPVSLAFDLLHTYDDGLQSFPAVNLGIDTIPRAVVRRRASTLELGVGLRRAFALKAWSPYLGAGGSWVRATTIDHVIDPAIGTQGTVVGGQRGYDSSFGYWVGGGLMRRIGPRFRIGLTARYTSAKLTLPDRRVVGELPIYRFTGATREVEAGGRHIGLVLGWAFPERK